MSDHYFTLGVQSGATADEIKQAYLRLVKKYHPDKNKSLDATAKMAEINLAYETLCDGSLRKEYDLKHAAATSVEDAANDYAAESVQTYEGTSQYYPPHPQEDDEAKEGEDYSLDWSSPSWNASQFYLAACPNCKSSSKKGDKFCSQCGTSLGHQKCAQCDFASNSGIFVCSKCGYAFDPGMNEKSGKKKDSIEDYLDSYDDPASYEYDQNSKDDDEINSETLKVQQDVLSEIIRCPQCDEINNYSRGSCWQCGLNFETG